MRLKWRRLLIGIVVGFLLLQLAALALFNPNGNSNDVEIHLEPRKDSEIIQPPAPKNEEPHIAQPPSPGLNGVCEITHKDTLSALSRATTNECKIQIEKTYCDHKTGNLLPNEIKRTCKHAKTFIAPGGDIVANDYKENVNLKIAYFLIVHGRSVRQIKRLFKMIYHTDHLFYFHVDIRSDYLYTELEIFADKYPNVEIASWREAPIWGGTSLLTTIMKGLTDLVRPHRKWDFFINLSFADLPVKSNDHMVQFLNKHRDKNFMKSHGREADKFVKKQGLNRIFLECENHMWRLGERELPKGIIVDGGSDWIALNRKFSDYLVNSKSKELAQFKTWFNYTLLPAESFFHTVVQNTEFCESFIDNNLRMTNWNRARGCKCQYKHIVDWCGCSPNDFMVSDLERLKTPRPIFFARKFEEFVMQEAVNRMDNQIYGPYPEGTPSLNSYWENIWNKNDKKSSGESKPDWNSDAKITHFSSWRRRAIEKVFGVQSAKYETELTDVTIFLEEKNQVKEKSGYVLTFKSYVICDKPSCPNFIWESYMTTNNNQEPADEQSDINVQVEVGSNWDVKELVFRDPGGIIGSFSDVHSSFRFKNVQKKFNAVAVIQDPSGYPADQLDMEIPEDEKVRLARPKSATYHCEGKLGQEVVAAEKLALRAPLRPGIWTISLYIRHSRTTQYIPGSRKHFVVSPLNFAYGKQVTKNADSLNGGVKSNLELNEKNKDLSAWAKLLNYNANDEFANSLAQNATHLGSKLEDWIDTLSQSGWKIESSCGPEGKFIPFDSNCQSAFWSTFFPDPKSELIDVNEHGRIR